MKVSFFLVDEILYRFFSTFHFPGYFFSWHLNCWSESVSAFELMGLWMLLVRRWAFFVHNKDGEKDTRRKILHFYKNVSKKGS